MIFVTVGTHEQQFNRLIKKIDQLKKDGHIKDDVFIQTGFSDYIPESCDWKKFLSYEEMIQKIKDAKIVITHGGPSSFILPLLYGKTPIVVPRMKKYDEHVNNHQVEFCRKYNSLNNNIIVVVNVDELNSELFSIVEKKTLINSNSNTLIFCKRLSKVLEEVLS
ncbi:multidrug MFS transporter [Candidatus Saccharibacteria bacterium]|nr:multidrug MFS transporter [Candidatus Saccharibacteria bacterium]